MNPRRQYFKTSLWLMVPPLLISLGLWSKLPHAYSRDVFWIGIPSYVSVPENVLRVAAFASAALLPFGSDTPRQKRGVLVYLTGLCLYAASYGAEILFPESAWSQSPIGFLAPAWTPLLWLVGIGLMAGEPYSPRWFRRTGFIVLATAFVAVHVTHAAIVFVRIR